MFEVFSAKKPSGIAETVLKILAVKAYRSLADIYITNRLRSDEAVLIFLTASNVSLAVSCRNKENGNSLIKTFTCNNVDN